MWQVTKKKRVGEPMTKKTIKSGSLLAALLALCILLLFILRSETIALDNPHNVNNTVNCGNCHITAPPAEWWTDQGNQANGICGQCHNPSGATDVKPHASPTYGGIVLQCTECHNPHYQRQNRVYRAASYLHSAASDNPGGVTTTTIKQTGAGWTVDEWAGKVLIPDVRYQALTHRIASNTADTITINTGGGDVINTTYVKDGATFAIVYGKLIKEYMRGKTVKFFRDTGTNSFADSDGTIDGVCQVCHTQTKYFKADGSVIQGAHAEPAGADCATCHTHIDEFKAGGCDTCHGDPPVSDATLIFADKGGAAVTSDSPVKGNNDGGSHTKHNTVGLGCANCHTGGMLGGASQGDDQINIGLNLNSTNLGGNYDGITRTVYPYAGGGTTSVSTGGTLQCTNFYCHSQGTATYAAPNQAPVWGAAASGACGDCHNNTKAAPPGTGSHAKHVVSTDVYRYNCYTCHTNTVNNDDPATINTTTGYPYHVNQARDVAINGGGAWNDPAASQCNTVYCHSNAKATTPVNAYANPTWGTDNGTLTCASCHGNPPGYSSGSAGTATANSHVKHVTGESIGCQQCHNDTTTDGTSIVNTVPTNHADGSNSTGSATGDVVFATGIGGTYTYGVGNKTCATTYCHGSTVQWGNNGTLTCNSCHQSQGADNSTLAARFAPAHVKHTSTNAYTYSCEMCHALGNATEGNVAHAGGKAAGAGSNPGGDTPGTNQYAEIRFRDSGATWATAAYKGSAVTTYKYRTLYASPYGATAPSPAYADGTGSGTDTVNANILYSTTGSSCSTVWCHSNANPVLKGAETNRNTYRSQAWTGTLGCTACHLGPDTNATMTTAIDRLSTNHAPHVANDRYNFTCDECHAETAANDSTTVLHLTTGYANHADATKSWKFSTTIRTSGISQDTGSFAAGNCSNLYCHSKGTRRTADPTTYPYTGDHAPFQTASWTGSLTNCNGCHGNVTYTDGRPAYNNATPKANSHLSHLSYACNICHYPTTQDGSTIFDRAQHLDLTYDVNNSGGTITYTPGTVAADGIPAGGTCSIAACHGSGTPQWGGASIACSGCHARTTAQGGDLDNFAADGTIAQINSDEWAARGHGLPAASNYPDPSGTPNPGADFVAKAGGGQDACLWCHDKTPEHNITSANPYRLRNNNSLGNGWNDACLHCHDTNQTTASYKPVAAFTTGINLANVVKVDKWHDGLKHGAGREGGTFCWDCHDPHGDTANQIKMVQRYPTKNNTDATNGVPTGAGDIDESQEVVFTDNTVGAGANGFARNAAPFNAGICNACHTTTDQYRLNTGAGTHDTSLCTVCHEHNADTTNDGNAFKGAGECITCHDTGGSGVTASRRAIVPEFNSTWSHKRTAGGTVTNNDCAVCHAEAVSATNPTTSSLHKNNVVDLRDPDTGNAITGFTEFTRDTGNPTLETHVTNTQNLLCLKCHDATGAQHASAQVPTTGTALRPFGTAPTHTPGNNVLNVDAQFDTGNATFHPIKGPQNNPYCNTNTMVTPWNTKTAGSSTPVNGPQISCWDCHPALNTAHGGGTTLRAPLPAYASSPTSTQRVGYSTGTLCSVCHDDNVYTTGGGINGSAFGGQDTGAIGNFDKAQHGNGAGDGEMPFTCNHCHGSSWADPGRPTRAADAHGFNGFTAGGSAGGGTTWLNGGSRPYAFLRMDKARGSGTDGQWKAWRPREDGATTNTTWGCNWTNSSGGGACNRGEHDPDFMSYGPGGVF
ncbi:MAG TPA: hypothetical protein DCO77_01935 [Nitrospiraceae bacterium]|nr:hypothetical protein [Nitrospiraceae bacterium]